MAERSFELREIQDISTPGCRRATCRIVFDDPVPSAAQFSKAAVQLLSSGCGHFDELTVFAYMTGMDVEGLAVAVVECYPGQAPRVRFIKETRMFAGVRIPYG